MQSADKTGFLKRSQKDYLLSFKLQLVQQIQHGFLTRCQAKTEYDIQGESTVGLWLKKYSNFDQEHQSPNSMAKKMNKNLYSQRQK